MFDWLFHVPLALLGMALFITMVAAAMAGYALRQRQERRDPEGIDQRTEAREGLVITALLTLLGLLIGFTFALAIDRYEERRLLVVDDANAIETLYLQAQLLEEPHRTRFSHLLVRYVDNHVALGQVEGERARPLLAENERLLTDLWTATVPAFETIRGIDFSSTFVDSVNQVVAMDGTRKAVRYAQIPSAVFALLFVLAVVTAFVLGNVLAGPHGRLSSVCLLALFTLALLLLSDLNRPVTGLVRESQFPMERLQRVLRDNPPAIFDRLRSPPAAAAEAR